MMKKHDLVAVVVAVLMLPGIGVATAGERASSEPAVGEPGASEARAVRRHSLNLGFGTLIGVPKLTYEYLWADGDALVVEAYGMLRPTLESDTRAALGGVVGLALDLTGLSRATDHEQPSAGIGAAFGYRRHWPDDAFFLGILVGADIGQSVAENSSITFATHTSVYAVGHIGKRWRLGKRYNLTARAGAGLVHRTVEYHEPEDVAAVRFLDDLVDRYPVTIDGELSLGYSF